MRARSMVFMISLLLIVLFAVKLTAQVREPYLAGRWYPKEEGKLSELLKQQFNNIHLSKQEKTIAPFALISPHAGLQLSGVVAAYGYSLLKNDDYDTVILIGTSHNYNTGVASIYDGDFYKSPMGKVPIDKEITSKLFKANNNFVFSEKIHYQENSLETQIPYLQYVLNDFKIVPILTATQNLSLLDKLSEALTKIIEEEDRKFLLIASTDMSHYHSMAEAKKMDEYTIELIENADWQQLSRAVINGNSELCGYYAVYTLVEILKNFNKTEAICLKYLTSGHIVPASASRGVVGYSSFVFPKQQEKNSYYSSEEKRYLLELARESIKFYLDNNKVRAIKPPKNKKLIEERAVFVTLNKNGKLRGCIGQLKAQMALYKAVNNMAVSAAFNDYRFPPLNKNELNKINIEISILTPLKRIDNISNIEMGKDGVYIKKGFKSGVFLPQVAKDTGWDKKTFLENLCSHKAGLAKEAYLDDDTEVYTFRVIKFEE